MIKEEQEYYYNCSILEIASNWDYIIDLFEQIKNKTIKQVSNLNAEWYHFIVNNSIKIYDMNNDVNQFLNTYYINHGTNIAKEEVQTKEIKDTSSNI